MATGKDLVSVKCEQCGTVVMETFLATHMWYVHTDAADRLRDPVDNGRQRITKRTEASKPQTQAKATPLPRAAPIPLSNVKTVALSLKKPQTMVQEIEHRVIVVRYHENKPKAKLPAKRVNLRCTTCGLDLHGTDAAAAHMKTGKCATVNKEAKRAKDLRAKAPRSCLPDGFEPSSSVRTVSGGLPGLGKRSR